MTVLSVLYRFIVLASAVLSLTGCLPTSESELDEEKNPYYLKGKALVRGMDYNGAAEAFEKAIETNPKSAAAHLELGLLYEQRMSDYATAIYHFQKHLKLKPTSNMAETVKAHVMSCKLELAKTVPFALVSSQVQVGIDRLTAENNSLKQQIEDLKTQLAQQAAAALTNRPPAQAEKTPERSTPSLNQLSKEPSARPEAEPKTAKNNNTPPSRSQTDKAPAKNPQNSTRSATKGSSLRAVSVKAGDTVAAIARRYGVSPNDVLAANPGLNPRRLRGGQTIYVPVK